MKILNSRIYSLTSGIILFALGFFGFAFRSYIDIPDKYLIISLALGFWGIVAGVSKNNSAV